MLLRGSLAALVILAASSAVAAPLSNVAAAAAASAPVRNLVVERDNWNAAGEVQFNITYQSNHTAHLPKTLIMATGCAQAVFSLIPPICESPSVSFVQAKETDEGIYMCSSQRHDCRIRIEQHRLDRIHGRFVSSSDP